MKTHVCNLGGDLAVPLPAEVAQSLNMQNGSEVDVIVEDGKIVVRLAAVARYSLDELLAQVTDENRHELVDWGPPVGREIW